MFSCTVSSGMPLQLDGMSSIPLLTSNPKYKSNKMHYTQQLHWQYNSKRTKIWRLECTRTIYYHIAFIISKSVCPSIRLPSVCLSVPPTHPPTHPSIRPFLPPSLQALPTPQHAYLVLLRNTTVVVNMSTKEHNIFCILLCSKIRATNYPQHCWHFPQEWHLPTPMTSAPHVLHITSSVTSKESCMSLSQLPCRDNKCWSLTIHGESFFLHLEQLFHETMAVCVE